MKIAANIIIGVFLGCQGSRLRNVTADVAHLEEQGFDDFGLDDATWLGLEGAQNVGLEAQNLTGVVAAANMSGTALWGHFPPVLLLGTFNTGTNLLTQLIQQNFPGLRSQYNVFHGLKGNADKGPLEIWKHIKPAHLAQHLKQRGTPDILRENGFVAITTIRDPMSWTMSMKKAPYNIADCMKDTSWPSKSCDWRRPTLTPPSWWWGPPGQDAIHVQNVEQLWNQWHWDYDNLDKYGFTSGKFVSISYEELVLDTWGALKKISDATGAPMPTRVQQIMEAAKDHGQPNGRELALRKLRTKSYLNDFTQWDQRAVCQRLWKPQMQRHNYHSCDGLS